MPVHCHWWRIRAARPNVNTAVTTTIGLRFDGRSTAYHMLQGLIDVIHQWPLIR